MDKLILKTLKPVHLASAAGGLAKLTGNPWGFINVPLFGATLRVQCSPEQAAAAKQYEGKEVHLAVSVEKARIGEGTDLHLVEIKAA